MSEPPQINAELTAILGPGTVANYTRAAGVGPIKWQGESGCYVQEKVVSGFNTNGELNRELVTKVFINGELTLTAPLAAGDTLVYSRDGRTFTRRVQNLDSAEMPGAPRYACAIVEEISAT